jgi:hypothetical protein
MTDRRAAATCFAVGLRQIGPREAAGSVDEFCLRRFDSSPVLGRLLDTDACNAALIRSGRRDDDVPGKRTTVKPPCRPLSAQAAATVLGSAGIRQNRCTRKQLVRPQLVEPVTAYLDEAFCDERRRRCPDNNLSWRGGRGRVGVPGAVAAGVLLPTDAVVPPRCRARPAVV